MLEATLHGQINLAHARFPSKTQAHFQQPFCKAFEIHHMLNLLLAQIEACYSQKHCEVKEMLHILEFILAQTKSHCQKQHCEVEDI